MTHTVVHLEISPAAFEEIKTKLLAAGYDHVIDRTTGEERLDMTHIALLKEKPERVWRPEERYEGAMEAAAKRKKP